MSAIPEELITLLHSISEDPRLSGLILRFEALAPIDRQRELLRIANRMRAGDEDPALIAAFESLAQPRLFAAACATLRELTEP